MALFRRTQRLALVASAQNLRLEGDRGAASTRRSATEWQRRALAFYDALGEVWYCAQIYARMISRVELYVGRRNELGVIERVGAVTVERDDAGNDVEVTPDEDDVQIAAKLDRIRDPRGGRAQLLEAYGRLRFLTGECYLVCTFGEGDNETWEALSVEEFRPLGEGKYERTPGPTGKRRELQEPAEGEEPQPGQVMVYRLWNPHPRFSEHADCAMRGVLDICEELLLLTLAVRAKARSRACGPGMLYVPIELDLPKSNEVGVDELSKFMTDLTKSLTTPLSDEGSATSVVPFILRGPAEFADKVVRIAVAGDETAYPEQPKIDQAINRLAMSLDMPPERLLGTGDVNHWGAWQVDEDTWKSHGQPLVEQLCQELTVSYLWPELSEPDAEGNLLADDPGDYLVWYDASQVVSHPDRGKSATEGHDRMAISDAAWREANGFEEHDSPSDAERQRRVEEKAAARGRVDPMTEPGDGEDSGAVERGAPEQAARIEGAIAFAIHRAREAAGARLRQKLRRSSELTLLMGATPNDRLAAELGHDRCRDLANGDGPIDEVRLCSGAGDVLRSVLIDYGVAPHAARLIAAQTHRYAADTLWLPAAEVPPALQMLAREHAPR